MSTETPIWFLDVDGVINVLGWSIPDYFVNVKASPGYGVDYSVAPRVITAEEDDLDFRQATDQRYYLINYDPEIIERITNMHESGAVEVIWTTTWGRGANGDLREKLGLPEFRVLADPPPSGDQFLNGVWWKFHWVRQFVESQPERRYIWTDDDLALEPDAIAWGREHNFLCISPNMNKGLTESDLNLIEKFVSGRLGV